MEGKRRKKGKKERRERKKEGREGEREGRRKRDGNVDHSLLLLCVLHVTLEHKVQFCL